MTWAIPWLVLHESILTILTDLFLSAGNQAYTDLSQGRLGMIGAVLGRAEAHVRRIAALYALLDRSATVDAVHLRAALALWGYAEASVAWIFASMGDATMENTTLRGIVKAGGLDDTAISTLFGKNAQAATLAQVKRALQREGLIHLEKQLTGWTCPAGLEGWTGTALAAGLFLFS